MMRRTMSGYIFTWRPMRKKVHLMFRAFSRSSSFGVSEGCGPSSKVIASTFWSVFTLL